MVDIRVQVLKKRDYAQYVPGYEHWVGIYASRCR